MKIASSQFPMSDTFWDNAGYIVEHMELAAKADANVVHFPETALSGYAGAHHTSLENLDWQALERCLKDICDHAARLGIWVVLGSTRQMNGKLPGNCIHVISDKGDIVGTYDKQRLYSADKQHYSAGTKPLVVEIEGIRCGFLVCYDSCFPELYDAYRDRSVSLLFHSSYTAKSSKGPNSLDDLTLAQTITRAADNQMWISASNSSEPYSRLASCIVKPDGSTISAERHKTDVVMAEYSMDGLGWTYDNRHF